MKNKQPNKLIVDTVIEQLHRAHAFETGATDEAIARCRRKFLHHHRSNDQMCENPMAAVDSFLDALRDADLVSTFAEYDEVAFTFDVVQELVRQEVICIDCSEAELRSAIEENVAVAAARREECSRQTAETLERLVEAGKVEVFVLGGVRRYRLVHGATT